MHQASIITARAIQIENENVCSFTCFSLQILQDPVMDPNNVDLSPVEATLRNKLMPFQEQGVR